MHKSSYYQEENLHFPTDNTGQVGGENIVQALLFCLMYGNVVQPFFFFLNTILTKTYLSYLQNSSYITHNAQYANYLYMLYFTIWY